MYAIIHPITPFDSAKGTTISFTWNGNQIYKVRCIIKKNETNDTVFDETISTMKPVFTISNESGLVNGTYYVAFITVFDVDDNESMIQNIGTPFYCFSTPTFKLSISNDAIIKSSTYSIDLIYSQAEKEELDSYKISLYSYQKAELQTTGYMYDLSHASFIISELENAKDYYVRAIGTTINGMQLDTGYIHITTAYVQHNVFHVMELNNRADIGGIEIRSNIISTEGHSEKPVVYLEGGGVDLTDNKIDYTNGFMIEGDFSAIFKIRNPLLNTSIITITDINQEMTANIYYREGSYASSNGKKGYFELVLEMSDVKYVRMSNYFSIPEKTQEIVLYVNRIDIFFDLNAIVTDIIKPEVS